MRRRAAVLLAALSAALPGAADEPPPALFEAAEEVATLCSSAGGTPAILPGYKTTLDLNGDGREDYLTDPAHLDCAGAAGGACGADGCPVTAWLSDPGGRHVAFDLGPLRRFEVLASPGPLPSVRAHYDASRCDAASTEGCTRTWMFTTNAPATPEPDTAEASAAERPPPASAEVAEPAPAPAPEPEPQPELEPEPEPEPVEPVPPGWTLREAPGGGTAAVGGGTGNIASLTAFCLQGQPFLAVRFLSPPEPGSLALGFAFEAGDLSVEAGREATAGGAYVVALADTRLAAQLAGRDSEVAVRTGDAPEGILSLAGSTRAIRAALADCYNF